MGNKFFSFWIATSAVHLLRIVAAMFRLELAEAGIILGLHSPHVPVISIPASPAKSKMAASMIR